MRSGPGFLGTFHVRSNVGPPSSSLLGTVNGFFQRVGVGPHQKGGSHLITPRVELNDELYICTQTSQKKKVHRKEAETRGDQRATAKKRWKQSLTMFGMFSTPTRAGAISCRYKIRVHSALRTPRQRLKVSDSKLPIRSLGVFVRTLTFRFGLQQRIQPYG